MWCYQVNGWTQRSRRSFPNLNYSLHLPSYSLYLSPSLNHQAQARGMWFYNFCNCPTGCDRSALYIFARPSKSLSLPSQAAQSNEAHSTLLTQNWTSWVGFTPRTAQEWFCCATGPEAFHHSCEDFLSQVLLISLLVGQLLSKQGELLKLLENSAFTRTYRSKQLPEQKGACQCWRKQLRRVE